MNAPQPPTVAYLTKRFPRLSETFILDEILGLEHGGVPLRLYAVADPGEAATQPDVARVASPITYLRHRGWRGAAGDAATGMAAHLEMAVTEPRRYRRGLGEAWRSNDRRVGLRHWWYAGVLAASMKRCGARHLHAAFAHTPASIARYTHLLTGVPFSFAVHAKDLYRSDPAHLAVRAAEARFVLACSRSIGNALAERSGSAARVVLAYHGVDTERFTPGTCGAPPGNELRILAVGRLVAKKGYPVLLDAIAHITRQGGRVRLEIVGDGELASDLAAQVDALGLGEVVAFAGARTHQEIAACYREVDVFVQASVVLPDGDRDGIPNSLLEAMATGLPVVATRVAGIPEVVAHDRNGLLVEPGDSAALAGAIAALSDEALRRRLGAAARQHLVSAFDRSVCAREVAALFAEQTGCHRHPEAFPPGAGGASAESKDGTVWTR